MEQLRALFLQILFIFLITTAFTYPQNVTNKNNILYVELFGNGVTASFNYERVMSNHFSTRLGLGFIYTTSESNSGYHRDFGFLPLVMINYLYQIYGNNYFELGGGAITSLVSYEPTFAAGYRYSPNNGGFFFSLALDMFTNFDNNSFYWGGMGIGARF